MKNISRHLNYRSVTNRYVTFNINSSNFSKSYNEDNIIILTPYSGVTDKTYYFKFVFDNSLKKKTIQIKIPNQGQTLAGYKLGSGYFTPDSKIYIGYTTFPYPLYITDRCDVDVSFEFCTFKNIGYNNPDRLYYNSSGTNEISAKKNYLVYFEKNENCASSATSMYYIRSNNVLELPDTSDTINPVQVSFGDVTLLTNESYFTLRWGATNSRRYVIGSLDSSIFNRPIIYLKGSYTFQIVNPLTIPIVFIKQDNTVSILQRTTFCNGLYLDLSGPGEITLDTVVVYTPPIISSNVYVVTTYNSSTKLNFISSTLVTGYGNSYLWNPLGGNVTSSCSLPVNTLRSILPTLVSNSSVGNVNILLSKGQTYDFSSTPHNLIKNNTVYLCDSNLPYSFYNIATTLKLALLTKREPTYVTLNNSLGYKIAFNTNINDISSANISTVQSNSGLTLYSDSDCNIYINSFSLQSENTNYILNTLGDGYIVFSGGSYSSTLRSSGNFWNNNSNLVFKDTNDFSYNLLPNVFVFTNREYFGNNSFYYEGINLLSNSAPYTLVSEYKLIIHSTEQNCVLSNCSVLGGLEIHNMSNLSLINCTLKNTLGTYIISSCNSTLNLISSNLYLNTTNFVTNNVFAVTDINSIYNLIGNQVRASSFQNLNITYSRYLEKNGLICLNNGIYNLNGIVNDITVSNVNPITRLIVSNTSTITSTVFPNSIKLILSRRSLTIIDSELNNTFDVNYQPGTLNFSNSTINVINGYSFFVNYSPLVFNTTDLRCTYIITSYGSNLNSDPTFINRVYVKGPGDFTFNNINRQVTYNTVNDSCNLIINANKLQVVNAGVTTNLGGNINVSNTYALVINGNTNVNVTSPLNLSSNKDVLYLSGVLNFSVSGDYLTLNTTYSRVPITSNITGEGRINIANTYLTNTQYPYIYWPSANSVTTTNPLITNRMYVATSVLPNTFTFEKRDSVLYPQSQIAFTVFANSSVNQINSEIVFYEASNVLPGVASETVNDLFNDVVVAKGYIGGLNNFLKTFTQSGNKYTFYLNFNSDPNNYYIGSLKANLNLSDGVSSYPNFSYLIKEQIEPGFYLELTNGTEVISNVSLDVFNDTSQSFVYKLKTLNSRPLILDAYVYSDESANLTSSYNPSTLPIFNGTRTLTIEKITGIVPDNEWTIDMDVQAVNLSSTFTLFSVDTVQVYVDNETVCVRYLESDVITYNSVFELNHVALSFTPYFEHSDKWLNNGYLKLYINDGLKVGEAQSYDFANINVSSLILGDGFIGKFSNVRVAYKALTPSEITEYETKYMVFFNPMNDPTKSLSEQELALFNTSYCNKVVFGTLQGENTNYTYFRPDELFCQTENYDVSDVLDQNVNLVIDVKGDTTTDNYWDKQTFALGAYFTPNPNKDAQPICRTTLTIVNNQPNYLFPLARYQDSLLDNRTYWSGFSGNTFALNDPLTQKGNLSVDESEYTKDFYLTIKMANLPDSGYGNIFVYTDQVNNDDITFTFYDAVTKESIMETYNGIDGTMITFYRNPTDHYVNRNSSKSIFVKALIDGSTKITGNSYYANIAFQPLFDVESFTSGTETTITSLGMFTFVIPYLVKLTIDDSPQFTFNTSTLEPLIVSPYSISRNTPVYLYASLLSFADANIDINLSEVSDIALPFQIVSCNVESNSIIDTTTVSDFKFRIDRGSNFSSNYATLQTVDDSKIWGDANLIISVSNLTVNNTPKEWSNASIQIAYIESERRSFNVYNTNLDNKSWKKVTSYFDTSTVSSELITSQYTTDGVTGKEYILSKQLRQAVGFTTNSIPHTSNGTVTGLKVNLSFSLVSAGVEKDVTDQVLVYDGSSSQSNITDKSVTLLPSDYSSVKSAYIDVSEVNFRNTTQLNGRVINVYGNVVPTDMSGNVDLTIPSDYSEVGSNILLTSFDYSSGTVDYGSSQDNIIIGNWKIITGPDGKLLVQYKNSSTDSWVTKAYWSET